MNLTSLALAGALATVLTLTAPEEQTIPKGWVVYGETTDYEVGKAPAAPGRGSGSIYVKSTANDPQGFATSMQTFQAANYRNERLRFSADVKAHGVEGWAGLWLRIDGSSDPHLLAFDNMEGRPIKGDSNWQNYAVVLDVPPSATSIAFGVLLAGKGQVWMDTVKVEAVSADVATTGGQSQSQRPFPTAPRNLDFTE